MRLVPGPVLLAALLLPPLAFAQVSAEDPVVTAAQSHAQGARSHATHPRAAAHLFELHALRDDLPDLHLLAQTYSDLLYRRSTHPEVKRVARTLLMDVEAARGRLAKVDAFRNPLGYVDRYWVQGAFDNEGKSGCDIDHGPEANLDLAQGNWRKLSATSRDGYVDLAQALRPTRNAVAYALTFIEAPEVTRADLAVGTSGAFRLWVNGEKVLTSDNYNLPRPDQAKVSVRLRKGHNRVLLKVCQEQGPLGFYLRHQPAQTGASSMPSFPDGNVLPPVDRAPSAQPQRLPTLASLLAAEAARRPDDASLRADYARILHGTRAFDERTHQDMVEARAAADLAPDDVSLQLLAARLHAEDHNLSRQFVERALARAPAHPLARLALGEHHLDRGRPAQALSILDPLVKAFPRFAHAQLAQARSHDLLGDLPRAVATVEQAFRRASQLPPVAREAARMSRRMERPKVAISRLRAALGLRHDDASARSELASLLIEQGRVNEAARELLSALRIYPGDNGTRLRLAELYAANEKLHDARRLFAEVRKACPDEPDFHEREGRALLLAGAREDATAAIERALALRPQNPALRETLRSLQGTDTAWGLQHVVDVLPLVREADAFAKGEDAVYLVDLTHVRVQASGQASRFHQMAVKVFTQRGADAFRVFPITWAPAREEVQILRVRITRPDGSVVESYGDHDRHINEPWTGMYYDARARELSFPALAPGDVLEVRYRLEDTARENLLSDYFGAVEHVQTTAPKLQWRYLVDMPSSRPLHWNRDAISGRVQAEVSETEEKGRRLYRFSADKVARIIPEPSMPGWAEVATTLHVSTYETWDQVGRYWWGLVRDQLVPNDELRRTVDEVLEGVDRKNDEAVVRALYNFVVTHTRYVALEFGIHGFKPYRVDRVLARRFGDCKDKASLIHAMLKVAGVDSRLVLLRMRNLGDIGEAPASLAAFNHAILYVPKLDLYLDGTAAFHGADELPTLDRAANILLVEPDGPSRFLTTPEAKAQANHTLLAMEVTLALDGAAQAKGQTRVQGVEAPEYRRAYQSAGTRKAVFEQGWSQTFPGLQVASMQMSDAADLDAPVEIGFELQIPRYAEVTPEGFRFYPFGSSRSFAQAWASLPERTHDLVLSSPWSNTFEFRHLLPEGYGDAQLPPDVETQSPYGTLRLTHRVEGSALISRGELTVDVARVGAKDYPAFRAFLLEVDGAFTRRITVKKGEAPSQAPQLPPQR